MKSPQYLLNIQRSEDVQENSRAEGEKPINKMVTRERENSVRSSGSLSFSASSDFVDFGIMSPTNPTLRTTEIKLRGSGDTLFLMLQPNHPLASENGTIIPSTTCDNGSCTENLPSKWISTLTYGFGLRCNNRLGSLCQDGYADRTNFTSLPDNTSRVASNIAKGIINDQPSRIEIGLKTNISGTQQPGLYENTLTYLFLLVP
jgi:hypothetical protein